MSFLKSLINHITKIISLVLLLNILLIAQQDSTDQIKNGSFENSQSKDSIFVMTKSPWGALLRSAVVPGWGQIYNESYWKAPVIWAISAWLVYNWIDNNNLYKDFGDSYVVSLDPDDRKLRNFYRDQRDLFSIYIGITYFLNLVDAYVDAHLFDFTVEEDGITGQPMLGLRFKF